MNTILSPSSKLLGTSLFARPMALSLTFSLLVHASTFTFFYRWNTPQEKMEQPIPVELVELPERTAQEEAVGSEYFSPTEGTEAKPTKAALPSPHTPSSFPPLTTNPVSAAICWEDPGLTSSHEKEATVSLDSQEPGYISYLSTIKRKIEPKWHYPDKAWKIGLQGRLIISFTISQDGNLKWLKLLNSSGHPLLDEGALQAVRDAAPYDPLPDQLNISRLNIIASFEYRISPYTMYGSSSKSGKGNF